MQYDFSGIDDVQSFVSVPAGSYRCRIAEVRPGQAKDGSARWSLRLEVAAGDYAGRTGAWDSVTWSERGVHRLKGVLRALGFDTSGILDVNPGDLVGREVDAELLEEEWEDPVTGRRQLRLRVPYAGYGRAEEAASAPTNGAVDADPFE